MVKKSQELTLLSGTGFQLPVIRIDKWGHLDPRNPDKVDFEPMDVVELAGEVPFLVAERTWSAP